MPRQSLVLEPLPRPSIYARGRTALAPRGLSWAKGNQSQGGNQRHRHVIFDPQAIGRGWTTPN
eukprot:2621377-Pyramimonas_sp.AAC.1